MSQQIRTAVATILLATMPSVAYPAETPRPAEADQTNPSEAGENMKERRELQLPLLTSAPEFKGPYVGTIEHREIKIFNGCTQPPQTREMIVLETADAMLPLLVKDTKEFEEDDVKASNLQLGDLVEVEGSVRTFLWSGTVAMAPIQGLFVEKTRKLPSGEKSHVRPKLSAKRVAPAEIAPIQIRDLVYRAESKISSSRFETWIVAERMDKQAKAPVQVWRTSVISGSINPLLETDVQDIRLKSLRDENGTLVATPESGAIVRIDAKTGKILSSSDSESADPMPTTRAQLKRVLTAAFNRQGVPPKTSEKTAEEMSKALWNIPREYRAAALRKTLEALQ